MLEALLAGDDGFSDEQIVDFLLALLVAGYETTSTIMTLAVKFLTETPLALAQLKVCSFSLSHSLSAATFLFFFLTLSFGGLFYVANNSLSSHGPIIAPTKQKMHTCFASLWTSFSLSKFSSSHFRRGYKETKQNERWKLKRGKIKRATQGSFTVCAWQIKLVLEHVLITFWVHESWQHRTSLASTKRWFFKNFVWLVRKVDSFH